MSLRNRKAGGAASRRDRHSKILTQQGPRDRRMRLSLEIARKFFHLQDILGFDKASKTVAWLLNNSKAAIAEAEAEARGGLPGRSSATSTPSSMYSNSDHCQVTVLPRGGGGGGGGLDQQKKTKEKRVVGGKAAKEWRAMARAKARERTEEKIRSRRTESFSTTPHDNAAAASSFNDCDDPLHGDSSSLGLVIKQQQQQLELGNEPIISNPFAHQRPMVDDDDDDECINASAASDQAAMINSIFDYQQQHLPHGVNSASHLGSFQNNDMTINFFPDNWGEMSDPNHPNAPSTTAMLFKASAHHVQFCPKAWNDGFNN